MTTGMIALAAGTAEASSSPTIMTMDWSIFWTFANIIILFIFLKIFLFDKVNKILDARKELIASNLESAEKEKDEAAKLKKEYETVLSNAEEETVQIIKEAKERAQVEYNKQVEASRQEASRIIQEANRAIELEKKKSMEQAQSEIAGIALLAAQKVIQKNVDAEDNKKLIGDFLQEAGGAE